ncbi:MAG: Rpn family recombination-promoting nuclease/putative transposase, partial [Deltaproteobacteria bacterium]|nr:Rpn family recombination-promoting nuclease/putative transposase [Deltaproteobacteria bacterium]
MNPITNPHDKFFKEVFTRRTAVTQFLEHYLPPDVAGLL